MRKPSLKARQNRERLSTSPTPELDISKSAAAELDIPKTADEEDPQAWLDGIINNPQLTPVKTKKESTSKMNYIVLRLD